MNTQFDAIIIGGGILGTSIAYNLTKRGIKRICVIEKEYLASGSTGRCGGGFRQQWSTEANTRLAMASVSKLEHIDEELGMKTECFQGGYLILAHTPEEEAQFKLNLAMQQRLGLKVEMVDSRRAREIVPFLDTDAGQVRAATWCPTDGHINPFLMTQAYAKAAKRNGAEVHLWTTVKNVMKKTDTFFVMTDKGTYQTPILVNCAGGFAREIGKMLNVEIPVDPYRHEILVTEPVERVWNPMVISFGVGIYTRQEANGGIIMGMGDPNEPVGTFVGSSMHFLFEISKRFTRLFPKLAGVRIVRQWAGLYEMTPDAQPVVGGVDEVEHFYQASGFSGHGLMLAPEVSEIMAELISTGKTSTPIDDLSVNRFRGMTEVHREKSVV